MDETKSVTPTKVVEAELDEFDQLVKSPEGTLATIQQQPKGAAVMRREVPHLEAWQRDDTYPGISIKPVTDDQDKALTEPLTDAEVDIKPDSFGAVYLSHSGYRRRLNKAFKPAGWALRRLTEYTFDQTKQIAYAEFALYGEGRYLGSALGEQRIPENNSEMSHGDIIEGLKSNALMRACKDLGMAMEAWDLKWTTDFRRRLCVKVWVRKGRSADPKPQWRRLDADPFYGETGCLNDSPNREAYQARMKQAGNDKRAEWFEGIDADLKTGIEKGMDIIGLQPGQRTAKITEFMGSATDASERTQGALKLYSWLKNEYSAKKAGAKPVESKGPAKPAPEPKPEVKPDVPKGEPVKASEIPFASGGSDLGF